MQPVLQRVKKNLHSLIMAALCDNTWGTEWFSLLFSVKSPNFRKFLLEILCDYFITDPRDYFCRVVDICALVNSDCNILGLAFLFFHCVIPFCTLTTTTCKITLNFAGAGLYPWQWQSISTGLHITLTTKKVIANNSLDLINKSLCCHT